MSRHGPGDHLTRSANWFILRAWPHIRRWLWVLHRVALIVAFVLSLLAVLTTICQKGLNDRPRDVGALPWTTRVWAAERDGGVTIRATTGRAIPTTAHRVVVASCRARVFMLLVVLVAVGLATMGMPRGT